MPQQAVRVCVRSRSRTVRAYSTVLYVKKNLGLTMPVPALQYYMYGMGP